MSLTPHQRLLALQRKIFHSLKAEARNLLGEPPASIRSYEREYRTDFRRRALKAIDKNQLIDRVRATDVTFIGDFHTFSQAQRNAFRLIRDVAVPGENWHVGLELVPSQFQNELDAFQNGKLSLEEFHELIRYQDEWGFPWDHYAPIFDWAREHQIPLVALNRPKSPLLPYASAKDKAELAERDLWAAGIITDLFATGLKRGERPKMMVLYGDMHVGRRHLPARLETVSRTFLRKPLQSLTIHQNDDDIYWELAREEKETQIEAVLLGKNVVCALSGTPWAKLQSLIDWAEGDTAQSPEPDADYLSLMQKFGDTICEFVGLDAPVFESLSVHSIRNADFIDALKHDRDLGFSRPDLRLIQFHVLNNHRIYIPRAQIAYIGIPSQNGAAELAGIHILRSRTKNTQIFQPTRDDFFRLTLEFAFGFFCSLVLNPRRKCDLRQDHTRRLKDLRDGARPVFPLEAASRALTVELLRSFERKRVLKADFMERRENAATSMLVGRHFGYVLGKALHRAFLNEELTSHDVRRLFLSRPRQKEPGYEAAYERLVRSLSDQVFSSLR